jgi:type IV pilus assembly protein PilC
MRAAEESGSLALTLEQLSMYLERSERLENKIKRSSTYPVFVVVFFCIVCTVMTAFVLPRFHEIFSGFDADLPLVSEMVFQLNQGLLRAAPWLGGICAVLAIGFMGWRRTTGGKYRIDYWKLRVPLFGGWLRKFAMARFCRNLAMMLRGGVPMTTAMEITASVSGNLVLRESILKARERLISGMSVSESLGHNPEFPRLVVRMVAMGEESGSLPAVLEKVSDVYEDQVEGSITVAMTLLEPIVICVFGFVVMLLILAIYMPVFTIGANVR